MTRCCATFATRRDGLGAREAERRLRQYGPDEVRRLERPSRLRELGRELLDPLALLLWMAVGFSLPGWRPPPLSTRR